MTDGSKLGRDGCAGASPGGVDEPSADSGLIVPSAVFGSVIPRTSSVFVLPVDAWDSWPFHSFPK